MCILQQVGEWLLALAIGDQSPVACIEDTDLSATCQAAVKLENVRLKLPIDVLIAAVRDLP